MLLRSYRRSGIIGIEEGVVSFTCATFCAEGYEYDEDGEEGPKPSINAVSASRDDRIWLRPDDYPDDDEEEEDAGQREGGGGKEPGGSIDQGTAAAGASLWSRSSGMRRAFSVLTADVASAMQEEVGGVR